MPEVPRGTKALRVSPALYEAIERGLKTETRRPLTAGNSRLTRGEFHELDLSSGRPDCLWPVCSLKCRIQSKRGERRSTTVTPVVRSNTLLWPRVGQEGPAARRVNAKILLRVKSVEPRRLCDLTEVEAWSEGIARWARGHGPTLGAVAAEAYDALQRQLGKTRLAAWRRGPVHSDTLAHGPTARDCFALLWETLNGRGSWAANPWVWRYEFEVIRETPDQIIEGGTLADA